jgi:signal transduction histidine kinase
MPQSAANRLDTDAQAAPVKPKILIADDEEMIQELLTTLVAPLHCNVLTARDGNEAMNLIKSERPHLVILDVAMPKMTGLQVTRSLKSSPATSSIPVVLVTGLTSEDDLKLGMESGADAIIGKPFSPQAVLNTVGKLLETEPASANGTEKSRSTHRSQQTFDNMTRNQLLIYAKELGDLYRKTETLNEDLQQQRSETFHFFNVLCHEIRTALTPVVSSTGLLVETMKAPPQSTQSRLLNNISAGVEILKARVEELLDLAGLQTQAFKINFGSVDVKTLLQETCDILQPSARRNHQKISLHFPDNLAALNADRNRLQQVFLNLLTNALKYSPPRSEVEVRASDRDGNLVIEIQDRGRGISLEEQARLFKPYYRVEQDRQRFPGLGLGLAICRLIVEAHGGKIWVESVVGQGSVFKIALPRDPQFGAY